MENLESEDHEMLSINKFTKNGIFLFFKSVKGIISVIIVTLSIVVGIYALKDLDLFQNDMNKVNSIIQDPDSIKVAK